MKYDGRNARLIEAMQAALDAQTSGNAYSFSQPIELRVQELIAGVRADVGISLYGDDLETLEAKAEEIASVLGSIPGAADVGTEQVAGLPYLRARIKRDELARYGINRSSRPARSARPADPSAAPRTSRDLGPYPHPRP